MSKAKSPTCPSCGKAATGNFCQHCGSQLGGRFCNQCGEKIGSGAQFCNQCGTPVAGPATSGARAEAASALFTGQNLPWWIAGGLMFAIIMYFGITMFRPNGPVAQAPAAAVPAGPLSGPAPDISNMTPIEQADRLFERIMTAVSEGDSLTAQSFMPMALMAYDRARPLTHDGLFHLSMLNRTAMNLDAALDNALEVLEEDPNHLLALAAAAEAAIEMGLLDEAETHYRQLAAVYDSEIERGLEEYDAHSRIVTVLKDDAERFLASR